MIQTKQKDLQEIITTTITRATNEKTLVSVVKQIDWIDPLLFYAAGNRIASENRCYFADPAQHVIFAGIGSVFTIANSADKRFQNAYEEWNKVQGKAIVHREEYEFGTGPLLFGGFSFDPEKEQTDLWKEFKDTTLSLPAFLLTVKHEKAWLTINTFISAEDSAQKVYEEIVSVEERILQECKEPLTEEKLTVTSKVEVDPKGWMNAIVKVQDEMRKGSVQKVVLARELKLVMDQKIDSARVLEALRIGQPDCYVFSFDYKGTCFLGATPERLIRKEDERFTSMCLAGSIGHGNSIEESKRNGKMLLHDEKNLEEHGYVVNMIRGVLDEHCESVNIPQRPGLLTTKNLLHLYTPVEAKGDASLLKMVEELHPTPALGGTPRHEAMRLIRDVELLDRGLYGAPIGWIDEKGNGEFAVALRCGLLNGDKASLFAGCGIVIDSVPQLEYEETSLKFRPMLGALEELMK
ncbi:MULTISPECIES: isochorismate synthase [Bacillus cereus group]|uniref:isochorismate synthase n=2 Tax=Bacillus cereus TaxID=1396 RepID=A0AA44Q8F0_BACCE|nr:MULTISPECIES: isochorismate synthase [Bacillus cereus group]PFA20730.1 isochorismate synthase [Bacillus cereus]PFN05664.1 isochorismate synthase [Bacillus cereus]PFO85635.1 isochorismate synthase [Bacillus cereus]PFR23641.1 isochorismate synthase [Bacillus cereus]PFR96837.1 isochorismate synthase [Bacillus cereus]